MGRIIKPKHGPEHHIQQCFNQYLRDRNWMVERTHGNLFQQGFPDVFVAHPRYGSRWIDYKNPGKYSYTKAQRLKWPVWEAHGVGIWIITGCDQANYDKLFAPPNWREYWKDSYDDLPDIDEVIDQIRLDDPEEA